MKQKVEPKGMFEAALREQIAAWQGHPTFAWAGECGIFAGYVWERCRDAGFDAPLDSFDNSIRCDSMLPDLAGVPRDELELLGKGLNHVWLVWEGRHYDAAHPEGVSSPFELRCVRQALVETMQGLWPERLQKLCAEHPWWSESARLLAEFLALHDEREAQYEEN